MKTILPLVLPPAVAMVLAFCVTPLIGRLAVAIGAVDMPGERKIHASPMPRLGGLAVVTTIAAGWLASYWLADQRWHLPAELIDGIGLGIFPILGVSLLDDVRPVRARTKLLLHFAGACIAAACGVSLAPDVHLVGYAIHLGFLALPISVLWIVGVTNAFNIIDGLDGLSAGLALIAASSMAAVFFIVGQHATAGAMLVVAGALAGFLPYNVHPAKLFLGDTGATSIGFALACFALKGGSTLSGGFAALVPVFIMGLPIADTLIAMARRLVAQWENVGGGMFAADRNHIHHRLLALGIDHGRAVLILYCAGFVLAAAGFLSVFLETREAALFLLALVLGGFVGVRRLGYDEFAFIKRGTVLKVYETPVVKRSMFIVFVDIAIVLLTSYFAVALKLDTWNPGLIRESVFDLAGTLAPITVAVFWKSGMYKGSWKRAGIEDLVRACGATLASATLGLLAHNLWAAGDPPASVFLIYALASTLIIAASRASYVVLRSSQRRASNDGTAVLIYGAGKDGVAAVRELFENAQSKLRPIAFIDDDESKVGRLVSGLPVVGTVRDLRRAMKEAGAQSLVVASSKIPQEHLQVAAEQCRAIGAGLFRMYLQFERLVDDAPVAIGTMAASSAVLRDQQATSVASVTPVPRSLNDLPPLDAQICRSCSGTNVHRSRARNLYERLRKHHTVARLYRCHDCGWRGWLLPLTRTVPTPETRSLDMSALDSALEAAAGTHQALRGVPVTHTPSTNTVH